MKSHPAKFCEVEAGWPGRAQHDKALRHQDVCDVPLDALARHAALVDAVEEQQRSARHQRLSKRAIVLRVGRAVLDAEEG
eukprot:1721123-Prymnesium_polylepis.1